MGGRLLLRVLDSEGNSFRSVDRIWKPTGLLVEPYRRSMLRDVQSRYLRLEATIDEIQELPKADVYVRLLTRMRLLVKRAEMSWHFDDLAFLQSVSGFYTNYGVMLRLLQNDRARGRFDTEPKDKGKLRL